MRTVIVIGRIGGDAQVKVTTNGSQVIEFSVANNEYGDKEGETHWFRVYGFDQRFIKLAPYLTKGKLISVSGLLKVGTFDGKDGKTHVALNINAHSIDFISTGQKQTDNNIPFENPNSTSAPVDNSKGFANPVMNTKSVEPMVSPIVTMGNKAASEQKPTVVTNSDDDDLPF